MRGKLVIAAFLLVSGMAQAAPDAGLEIGPGSHVFWTSVYDGGSDNFREALLIKGDDFEIYRNEGELSEGTVEDHFVVFSGLYAAPCNGDMPTADERSRLAEAWPLEPGKTLSIESGDGAEFTVGAAREFFLMGKSWPAHAVSASYGGDESNAEEFVILDDIALVVSFDWDENARDTATLVTTPSAGSLEPVATETLGNCAELLDTETQKN